MNLLMAKKTAAQKGYRKTTKKKPFLTKKELIALIIIVLVVIVGFIVIQNLPDGFIGEKDIQPGDVVSYASRDNRTRFFKVAEANELEGYTRSNAAEGAGPVPTYSYTPDDETSAIQMVTLTGSNVEASALTDSTLSYFTASDTNNVATEKMSTTVQGHDAYVFGYTYSYYDENKATEAPAEEAAEAPAEEAAEAPAEEAAEAPAEETAEAPAEETAEAPAEDAEPAPNTFAQNLTVYTDVDGEHTVALHLYLSGEDESFYIPDDQILDYVMPFTEAFTIVEKEEK